MASNEPELPKVRVVFVGAKPANESPVGPNLGHGNVGYDPNNPVDMNLLDLPVHLLEIIFLKMRLDHLNTCLKVHQKIARIITSKSFVDRYVRRELGLSEGDEFEFEMLYGATSPLLDLWYLSNGANMENKSNFVMLVDRSSPFFPIASYQHSFSTWITQASISSTDDVFTTPWSDTDKHLNRHDRYYRELRATLRSYYNRMAMYWKCEQLIIDYTSSYPSYVNKALTKLSLTVPHLIEWSLHADRMDFIKGRPRGNFNMWDDTIKLRMPGIAEPEYCLKITTNPITWWPVPAPVLLLIIFYPNKCIVFVDKGSATPYRRCTLHEFPLDISLPSLKNQLHSLQKLFYTIPKPVEVHDPAVPHNLFPNRCHQLHYMLRLELLTKLEIQVGQTISEMLKEIHQPCDIKDVHQEVIAHLQRKFSSEAEYFIRDDSCHRIMCNECSMSHPSPEQLRACMDKSVWSIRPMSGWPYHVIYKALSTLKSKNLHLALYLPSEGQQANPESSANDAEPPNTR